MRKAENSPICGIFFLSWKSTQMITYVFLSVTQQIISVRAPTGIIARHGFLPLAQQQPQTRAKWWWNGRFASLNNPKYSSNLLCQNPRAIPPVDVKSLDCIVLPTLRWSVSLKWLCGHVAPGSRRLKTHTSTTQKPHLCTQLCKIIHHHRFLIYKGQLCFQTRFNWREQKLKPLLYGERFLQERRRARSDRTEDIDVRMSSVSFWFVLRSWEMKQYFM